MTHVTKLSFKIIGHNGNSLACRVGSIVNISASVSANPVSITVLIEISNPMTRRRGGYTTSNHEIVHQI